MAGWAVMSYPGGFSSSIPTLAMVTSGGKVGSFRAPADLELGRSRVHVFATQHVPGRCWATAAKACTHNQGATESPTVI